MSDQKRTHPGLALFVGLLVGSLAGIVSMRVTSDTTPSQTEIQANLDAERTEAFIAGLCNGQSPCEGRLQVKTGNSAMEFFRVSMNRLYYAHNGNPATVPVACTSESDVLGNTCEFVRERLVREPPATDVQ